MNLKQDHTRLLTNLQQLQKLFSVKKLAEVLVISERTWNNRMKEPWRLFSYDDFAIIAKYCKIDFESLVFGTLAIR